MISLNSSLEKMIGFELAQYVSTRQSSLLLPGFSCSQGWDRGGRGDFWEGWSMSSNLGWEGSSSPQDQLKYNQCFYRNLAISQNLSLLVKYISPPICEQTKNVSWFKMWRVRSLGRRGKQEICGENREKGEGHQHLLPGLRMCYFTCNNQKPANKGKLCF